MTLKDEMTLFDRDDANQLMQFLRAHNISTAIRIQTSLESEISVLGTIKDLRSFLQQKIEELDSCLKEDEWEEEEEEEEWEDEGEWEDEDDWEEEDSIEEQRHMYCFMSGLVEKLHASLTDISSRYSAGDTIVIPDIFPEMNEEEEHTPELPDAGDENETGDNSDICEEGDDPIRRLLQNDTKIHLYFQHMLLATLFSNDCLEKKDDDLVLKQSLNPDDITLFFPGGFFDFDDITDLEGLQIENTISDEISYAVTIGPEFFMLDDINDITDFISDEGLDCEERDVLELKYRLANRDMIVNNIIEILKENGKMSREEIISAIKDISLSLQEEGGISIRFQLSYTFVGAIVEDLKKLGILKGKDVKLKLQI